MVGKRNLQRGLELASRDANGGLGIGHRSGGNRHIEPRAELLHLIGGAKLEALLHEGILFFEFGMHATARACTALNCATASPRRAVASAIGPSLR